MNLLEAYQSGVDAAKDGVVREIDSRRRVLCAALISGGGGTSSSGAGGGIIGGGSGGGFVGGLIGGSGIGVAGGAFGGGGFGGDGGSYRGGFGSGGGAVRGGFSSAVKTAARATTTGRFGEVGGGGRAFSSVNTKGAFRNNPIASAIAVSTGSAQQQDKQPKDRQFFVVLSCRSTPSATYIKSCLVAHFGADSPEAKPEEVTALVTKGDAMIRYKADALAENAVAAFKNQRFQDFEVSARKKSVVLCEGNEIVYGESVASGKIRYRSLGDNDKQTGQLWATINKGDAEVNTAVPPVLRLMVDEDTTVTRSDNSLVCKLEDVIICFQNNQPAPKRGTVIFDLSELKNASSGFTFAFMKAANAVGKVVNTGPISYTVKSEPSFVKIEPGSL